ncbi:ATP-binding cassette domain-containing protein [Muribaculum intestinale]|uniref:ATP-binding cassette domain-containing protein n=1 Tax=Muribaculum intestinale TaxID=1796646 RepID=UPI00242AD152|nr:ATP-binding cassette domain-containing protein [Muribaculum intestinale]
MKELFTLCSPMLTWRMQKIAVPAGVVVPEGVTVVFGPNGAGKSTLGNIIAKGWNITTNRITTSLEQKPSVKMIEFGDIHSLAGFHTEYYQQRLEATMNDDVPSVGDLLGARMAMPRWSELASRFSLEHTVEKKVNYLSSGELRKLLLVNALLDTPELLVLDNPYIGLDAVSRDVFNDTLREVAREGTSVMLLLCNPAEIPDFTDMFLPIDGMALGSPIYAQAGVDTVTAMRETAWSMMDYAVDLSAIPLRRMEVTPHDITFALRDCRVAYGSTVVLDHVDWTVRKGECWSLSGPNGSGKSLLLSLIFADNPQAYSNDITIFDKRRGSGESIWDIKRRIGYVSPEMHLYFRSGGTVAEVVAQGLRDTIGNFGSVSVAAREEVMRWLRLFHLEVVADMPYRNLSAGMQRLVLIARTFIKHPDLLIFDEPLHGLDAARKRAVRAVVNEIARRDSPTLVYVTHYLPEVPESVTRRFTLQGR